MMKRLTLKTEIRTQYLHKYNGNGSRRVPPCDGHLVIHTEQRYAYVKCDKCDEGYRFEFYLGTTPLR